MVGGVIMKLSIASLGSAPRPRPVSFAEVRRPKAHDTAAPPARRYAAKMIDLDDDDAPTWMIDTRAPRARSARV